MNRRAFISGSATAVSASLAGCMGLFGSGVPAEYDVGMSATSFVPSSIEVSVGESVVWYNNDNRPHTVTAYEDRIPGDATYFASGNFETEAEARNGYENSLTGTVDPGESYEHTFEVAGANEYFCIPHESGGMIASVIVGESD